MHLNHYKTEDAQGIASGDELIKLTGHEGSASVNVDDLTGTYDLLVGYVDENDGHSDASVKVNGHEVTAWTFDQHLGSPVADLNNQVQYAINDIQLNHGDNLIELHGSIDAHEFARFDYLKIVSSDTVVATGVQETLIVLS